MTSLEREDAGLITLGRRGGITVVVDADGGGEVRSITTPFGVELLFQAPWTPRIHARGTDDTSWVAGWRGGWSLLFPNAGSACEFDGRVHPYHGDAALSEWAVLHVDDVCASLEFTDSSGITVDRVHVVEERSIAITTTIRNPTEVTFSFVAVDHLILGEQFLTSQTVIRLPVGKRRNLDDHASDGRWEDIPNEPGQRFGCITGIAEARAMVLSELVELSVQWEGELLDSLWYWVELASTLEEPWAGAVRCLGIEPATTTETRGLAVAVAGGSARTLGPGAITTFSTTLTIKTETEQAAILQETSP